MEIVNTEGPQTLLPVADMLRPMINPMQSVNEEQEDVSDRMMVDDETAMNNKNNMPSLPSIKDLPSMAATSSMSSDDFIRHRLSDMSVSQPHLRQPISGPSPLEPNSHQPFYESFSRRGSITDPTAFHTSRRPSAAEILPLPNSATPSRRGSVTTDYSSRSPSPSAFSRQRYYDNHEGSSYTSSRRRSLTNGSANNKLPMPPPSNSFYDPFQRRHSIAITEPSYGSVPSHSVGNNHVTKSKHKAFRFPATIPESPRYETFSAPSSPPQPTMLTQEPLHDKLPRHSIEHYQGGSVMRHKASLIESAEPYFPARRASMPLVSIRNSHSLPHLSENAEADGQPRKETPYSRSPALRVSHKLAERKRRKEMKGLFDELRDSLPVEKDMKTSKWEILSKAVEYISLLKRRDYDLENEINSLRREIDAIKREKSSTNASNYSVP